ncbi:MAG TPA: DUF2085 domain-containing protein [Chloroflexi bacterium]|nr:DUF2085 domain-containing protein [Chloroflexota bacterium]
MSKWSVSTFKGSTWRWLATALIACVLLVVLVVTPGGILFKADWVGYAVCHRITERSFVIAGRQLPLCARCTGTFIGALLGLAGQALVLRRRRAANFPPARVLIFLFAFVLFWGADGFNSYMALIGGPHVYEPQNWLRLTTGSLQGLAMSSFVYPVFNFTLWRQPSTEANVRDLRELGILVSMEVALVALVLTEWGFLLYPLAILGALGVLTLLTIVNSMLLLMITRRDNLAATWPDAILPLLIGFVFSLIQIGLIDYVRYRFAGMMVGAPPMW